MNEIHPTESFDVFPEEHQGYTVFEMEKLKDYLEVVIDIRTREKHDAIDRDDNVYIDYKNCDESDFKDRKYKPDEGFQKDIPKFMCPDFGKNNTNFWVQGRYTD